jgi:NADPH:quinone reductase-like Zn-dependent oxidoreductase
VTIALRRVTLCEQVDVRGVMLARATPAERAEMAAHVCTGLRAGWLRALPHEVLELECAPEAHERTLARGAPGQGKMVLRVPPPGGL